MKPIDLAILALIVVAATNFLTPLLRKKMDRMQSELEKRKQK